MLNIKKPKTNYILEILSGLTIAITLVPESISFSFMAHTPPAYGLYAAIIMVFFTTLFGGRPGMITCAAGATAVVAGGIVLKTNVEYMLMSVALAGALQIMVGLLGWAKFIRLMPYSVLLGFVNGLAIIILKSQINLFTNEETGEWLPMDVIYPLLAMVIINIILLETIPKVLPRLTKVIPTALITISLSYFIPTIFNLPVLTIGEISSITSSLPTIHVPQITWSWETIEFLIPPTLILAGTGLIESLLTLSIIDDLTETRGHTNKEAIALGMGNLCSGFMTSIGGCALVGQSLLNINNGARTRLPGLVIVVVLVGAIMFGAEAIEQAPMGALIGLLIKVAYRTFAWNTFKILSRVPREDIFIVIFVTIVTVLFNLAVACILGLLIATLVFAWRTSHTMTAHIETDPTGIKYYRLQGPLFFGSINSFVDLFKPQNDPNHVVIDFTNSRIWDHSAIKAIDDISVRYTEAGISLNLIHLSPECKELLDKAGDLVTLNDNRDPNYYVLSNRDGIE